MIFIILLFIFTNQHIYAIEYPSAKKQLNNLEYLFDGKIGIFALNTANQQTIHHRSKERFPLQSTFKLIAVTAILKKSETGPKLYSKK